MKEDKIIFEKREQAIKYYNDLSNLKYSNSHYLLKGNIVYRRIGG